LNLAGWIDVHTHLNFLKDLTPEEGIAQAQAAGVQRMITIGTEPKDFPVVLDIASRHFPVVACTLGVHPHEGQVYTDEVESYLNAHLPEPHVVAVGEIGLDYYYDNSPREQQKDAFRRQLALAVQHQMPVEIHTRDAEADTIEILKEFGGSIRGLIHCFTGTMWLAREALDLGLDISFSGVVTFKSATELKDVARFVPLDRLHVETDAPFLTPMPHRGKSNVPAFVVHTAQVVCGLKEISPETLLAATINNARRTFPKFAL
jgi:TatD DNase family protein